MKQTKTLALGSLAIGVLVLTLKYAAYWMTGSVALYSDALESVINVVAASAALVAIHLSARPADSRHPFGYSKAEYFSAVVEGVLIVVAALVIFREAYLSLSDAHLLSAAPEALAFNGAASLVNGLWGRVLIRRGRALRSPALVADGKHLAADVVSSFGVLLGIGVAMATGIAILDPILAALVGVNILWSGWRLVRESVGGLMDVAAPDQIQTRIREIISENAGGAIEAHDVRTRYAGRMTFVDFHLVVPGRMPVDEAHDICDRIEAALKGAIDPAMITIHVEPEDKAKHSGIVVL